MKERACKIELLIAVGSDICGINKVIEKHYAFPPIYFKPALFSSPDDIEQSEESIIFIAKAQKEIVGFLSMHSRESFIHENNEAEFKIVVKPDYRNHGIGNKLLMYATQHTKEKTKLKQLIAKIAKGNDASMRLCKNCGFRELCTDQKGTVLILEMVR